MKNAFIDNLVREWSWRVNDGMPDPKKRSHVRVLEAVLRQYKYSEQFIYEYINQLTEDKEFKARSKESGRTVVYKSKEALEKAMKDGRAEPLDAKKAEPGEKKKVKGADLFKGKETDKVEKDSDPQPKREISGKDKTLSKGNPAETEEFNKELDTSPTGDEDFAKKNEKNAIPPPYTLPESITKNPKFPKRYAKALERMMNTQANKETSNWKYFSDLPGGAGRISAQAGELMTMAGSAMTDEEFEELITSLEKHEQSQIENNPDLKKEGTRIITKSWMAAARKSRKAILDRVKKQYDEGAEIIGSSWDAEGEVEAMGLSNYKKNKGFSTDMYLKIRKSNGEEILDEISLKKDKNINFLNKGLGDMVNDWDPELKGTPTDPKEYSKNERKRLVDGAKTILPPKVQKELESEISSTESGKGSRSKSKAILTAIKQEAKNGNKAAIKYIEDDDKAHRKMQEDAIEQLNTNPKVREGLIKSIKEEFPLKAVSEGEETMAVGDMSLDKETMKLIFGTDDFNELKENLSVKKTKNGEPYLVYEIKGKEPVRVANIVIRQDGRGYGGGTIKFEMKLHPDLAKHLDTATKEVYK
ncbi:hypothetical protein CMI47_15980 [Candidatus Pacearchaeota archaeon]|nr:hypothetical protein [Candidatus Pacearchaeota archaeon]